MPDPWVAVEATVRRSDKLAALPSDTARWGWLVMLGEAKLLRRQGTFSNGQWLELMGRYSKYLADYIETGLLHRAPAFCADDRKPSCLRGRGPFQEGTLVIHDWPRHQREHAVRQQDYRERDSESDAVSDAPSDAVGDSPSDVGSDKPSRALSLSPVGISSLPVENGTLRARDDASRLIALVEHLTGRTLQGNSLLETLGADMRQLGFDKVAAAYHQTVREADAPLDCAGVVYGGHKRLYPIPEVRRVSAADERQADIADAVTAMKEGRLRARPQG